MARQMRSRPAASARHTGERRRPLQPWVPAFAGMTLLLAMTLLTVPATADEEPKYGGTLTYMIPADAPPSFDGHRESTYATVHSVAPFYSVLIRVNPVNPSVTTEFVCDLCTELPQPTDEGKTYTFKIRQDVRFHDGSSVTAADVAASFNKIIFPADGLLSARSSNYLMVDKVEASDPNTVVFNLKFSAGARRPVQFHLSEREPRPGPTLVRKEHSWLGAIQIRWIRDRAVDQGSEEPRLLPQRPAVP